MAKTNADVIEELRARIASLEEDNENMMGIMRNMSKLFGTAPSPIDDRSNIPEKKINPIINRIGRGDPLSTAQVELINKFADESAYVEADWFRKQIITAFEKIYLRLNKTLPKKSFTYADVMEHVLAFSTLDDKLKVHLYVKTLHENAK